jgi:multimeric flavodoxin WrbA/putative sterol carrier protein
MKILALNSSARTGGESRTELLLNRLVKGMRQAGATVTIVHLRKKNIKNCIGCYTCMTRTPGQCIHRDDMTLELFPMWLESDIVVYASPLFHYSVNATMKAFIERTFPVHQPFLEQLGDIVYHPLRHKYPAIVLLSVAGFPHESVFDQLSTWANHTFGKSGRQPGVKLLAQIYRPASEIMIRYKDKINDILDATEQAGQELVKDMKVSSHTMARIKQPLDETEAVIGLANIHWQTCIDERVTPKQFRLRRMVPRPVSIDNLMAVLRVGFNPEAARDMKATLQFEFSGEVRGSCYLVIEDRAIRAMSGTAENPDLTIRSPFEVWADIITGKADGTRMFMEQKYSADGDMDLLMKFSKWFAS